MAQAFPQSPVFEGNFAPVSTESDAADLPIVGRLPDALAGTLYRNGPNPHFPPRDAQHHWFLGDGMVHAVHIEKGRASYRNRWVRTPKFEAEAAAGHALFGSWGSPATTDPSVAGTDGGVANTNVVWHAGRLLLSLPSAIAISAAGCAARSRRIPRSIRRPASSCSSPIRPGGR
jgi:carotenoid cleavage dioxygenase-like enzyme